ncbi:MAG: hypothetical protein A2X49_00955 [Lentisphaerae bacterium GWF2_52_8]|nr:MAG: hypothetical protein A2X49_00955 [Lentisphaerae bacterium GWF2_52_8]
MAVSKKNKVLGIGSPILDILVNVDDAFLSKISGKKGGMELVSSDTLDGILSRTESDPVRAPGGSSANTIVGLTRLGMSTAFLGKIGYDADGKFYQDNYRGMGGDLSCFRLSSTAHTGRCLSLVTPDSERTMRTDLGAAAQLSTDDLSADCFAQASHVHLEGYLLYGGPELVRRALTLARQEGCTVSLDLSSFEAVRHSKALLPEICRMGVDIIFANEDEARELCGEMSPEDYAMKLSEYSPVVAVKLGKKGCCLRADGKTVSVPALLVEAVDTTGAGDLWQSGFLYAWLNKCPLPVCGQYGSLLGAEVVQVMGAAIPEKRWPEIKAKLKQVTG